MGKTIQEKLCESEVPDLFTDHRRIRHNIRRSVIADRCVVGRTFYFSSLMIALFLIHASQELPIFAHTIFASQQEMQYSPTRPCIWGRSGAVEFQRASFSPRSALAVFYHGCSQYTFSYLLRKSAILVASFSQFSLDTQHGMAVLWSFFLINHRSIALGLDNRYSDATEN